MAVSESSPEPIILIIVNRVSKGTEGISPSSGWFTRLSDGELPQAGRGGKLYRTPKQALILYSLSKAPSCHFTPNIDYVVTCSRESAFLKKLKLL